MGKWRDRVHEEIERLDALEESNKKKLRALYREVHDNDLGAEQTVTIQDEVLRCTFRGTQVFTVEMAGNGLYKVNGAQRGTSTEEVAQELATLMAEMVGRLHPQVMSDNGPARTAQRHCMAQ